LNFKILRLSKALKKRNHLWRGASVDVGFLLHILAAKCCSRAQREVFYDPNLQMKQ